jgi:hypothetical protein
MTLLNISITLLVILGALALLTRLRNGSPGAIVTWMTYLVIVIAGGILILQVYRGCARMWHRNQCDNSECTSWYHHKGRQVRWMEHHMMDPASGMEKKIIIKKSAGDSTQEVGDVIRETTTDTIDGKIIVKETEIIRK